MVLALMSFYVNSPSDDLHELQNDSQTNLNTTGSHHGDLIFRIGDQSNPLQCHSTGAPPSLSPGNPATASDYI
jgi:hypothetical protein